MEYSYYSLFVGIVCKAYFVHDCAATSYRLKIWSAADLKRDDTMRFPMVRELDSCQDFDTILLQQRRPMTYTLVNVATVQKLSALVAWHSMRDPALA